ncbi:hypothetical protein M408DRAFT_79520, partial [Serendipita vermifera MAFF 305830]
KRIAEALPMTVMRWGKFRVKGEKNVVRTAWASERVSKDRLRDSSFVRLAADANAANPDAPDVPRREVFYGQLQYITYVVLPKNNVLRVREDSKAILGMVWWCRNARGNAAVRPVWYKDMGAHQAVNVSTIQCSVGRVETRGWFGLVTSGKQPFPLTFYMDYKYYKLSFSGRRLG